ncbi:hypothetical protein GUJ93_ZPchr0012g21034 [Zizania palustris]|uniref:Uncharacterized protein n=1 Tax=Zizania palustris TaxID=103762 RepID=A0A8J5WMG2_ZIZPA|nr:hypothetical protein GUJ93_ZPchr0012g21034 [Zizania palustris]
MEAEVAALSQLQLQLLDLVSDHRLLRERERAAREELHESVQRWKEAEERHRREARELRAEVAARDNAIRQLESRIKCLENENAQLEKNEKQDSSCSLQWTIQMKDKQIAVISEKLNAHLALFSSIGKEVTEVKQVLGDVKCLVGNKENIVSDLKGKVEKISVLEKDFVEKLSFLEEKVRNYQLELRNRARIIYELKERLEAEKLKRKFQHQLEEISILKDEIIERLTSEKQAMFMELHNMEVALRKFQDIFGSIGLEDVQEVVSKEQQQRIPGSQSEPPNEHTMIPIVEEADTTPNVECLSENDAGSKQAQSQPSLVHSALPLAEPVNANAETSVCLHESEDIDMDNSSPAQVDHSVNPNIESQNQS